MVAVRTDVGEATSPIRLKPSAVCKVNGRRNEGRIVLGRINSGIDSVYSLRMSTSADVNAAVEAAHDASKAWVDLGFSGRKKVLRSWASLLTRRINEIGKLIADETGKPLSDATLEATLAIEQLAWAANNAEKILTDKKRPSGLLMFNMSAKLFLQSTIGNVYS